MKIVSFLLMVFLINSVSSCRKDPPIPVSKAKIDTTTTWRKGKIFTIAGNGYNNHGVGGYSGDGGPATAAELAHPFGVAVDASGNVYIAEAYNRRIRKINSNGLISTIAGNGALGSSGDGGPAIDAEFYYPSGIAVDGPGNVYIADQNANTVRKITPGGIISTFAGNGYGPETFGGYTGDGGPATAAELGEPWDVCVDNSGNVYIADYANAAIRMVNTNGIITTVAGGIGGVYSGDGGPGTAAEIANSQGVAVDAARNIYIAAYNENRIRKVNTLGIISTIAGNGYGATLDGGYSGDGGPATAAELYYPNSVKADAAGNVYILDSYNGRIRVVDVNGNISTVAGNGPTGSYSYSGDGGPATDAEIGFSQGMAIDAFGNIYITDFWIDRVREVYK